MMKYRLQHILMVLLLAGIALIPGTASAQGSTSISAAGGLSLPTGSFSDRNESGYSLSLGLGFKQPVSPISFRVEGMYNEFKDKFFGDKSKAAAVTANAIYEFSTGPHAQFIPYAIGGIGYYSTREPYYDFENQSNMGWNIGGGVRFPVGTFSAYVESRYHSVGNVDAHFAPIVFGVTF